MGEALVKLVKIPEFADSRGRLLVCEFEEALPFIPVRTFIISDVPEGATRASHSVSCDLFLVVLRGTGTLTAATSETSEVHPLSANAVGVHVPAGTWILLSDFTPETQILVHASKRFREVKYVSDPPIKIA
ncbi:MAG: FdtA/QdtA family cupin domain-containing protein [Hyphomicrobium sp.]|uniref:sugar 3,4-ketoisomerase n=1 Tax=Hyphomicrobium sp. TaxID=82 RepID=UPI0039E51E0D